MYQLLLENDLCTYYSFEDNPGIKAKGKFSSGRFAYLEDESVINQLVLFRSENQVNISFELPGIHCSSCIYLLENLHRIDAGIISSTTNFQRKEILISFNPQLISLRKVVEMLSFVGYEPFISLKDSDKKIIKQTDRRQILKLGITGFCFSNIMMLTFPEYFSSGNIAEAGLKETFTWLIFLLSLPVLFYGAAGIFSSAFKGIRQKDLNIDVPIALAIVMTFGRSYYEIFTNTGGSGYLDSGCGIIFFMLIGRWFQGKTYDALSFDRDYLAYFPLGVTVIREGSEVNIPVTQLQKGETVILRHDEMIPADAVLMEGYAFINYSFVSGEQTPVERKKGDLLYAGGKQQGGKISLQVIKEPSRSYITELWNNEAFSGKQVKDSFIHPWSRYFTIVLLTIAVLTFGYWYSYNPSNIFPAVTSVLIVACPCSLLLSSTFTFGSMLRYFGKNKLYLKNSGVIEDLSLIDTVVFDKTGTLTESGHHNISYFGKDLSTSDKAMIRTVSGQSSHALSKELVSSLEAGNGDEYAVEGFTEYPGQGISAIVNSMSVKLGASSFAGGIKQDQNAEGSRVYVMIDSIGMGFFELRNKYRTGFKELVDNLKKQKLSIHILSGDNNAEEEVLREMLGGDIRLNFNATPLQKLEYIKQLQATGKKVLMVGDGLNDAGALMQSDAGIAVTDNAARFTPACDAILDGNYLQYINRFIAYSRSAKSLVSAGFVLSILYNAAGISFAVQAKLSPLVAAILMPASSISIVLIATLLSGYVAKRKGL